MRGQFGGCPEVRSGLPGRSRGRPKPARLRDFAVIVSEISFMGSAFLYRSLDGAGEECAGERYSCTVCVLLTLTAKLLLCWALGGNRRLRRAPVDLRIGTKREKGAHEDALLVPFATHSVRPLSTAQLFERQV